MFSVVLCIIDLCLFNTPKKFSNTKQKGGNMDIGLRIKECRNKTGLTLEELASRCELTKGFLSQLERNITSCSVTTLEDIVEALGMTMADFFKEDTDVRVVFGKEDFFVDEREDHTITWIVPNAQKNEMEPIMLDLPVGGKSQEVYPHEGEEFGYVLRGRIRIMFPDSKKGITVKKGQTFYIKGDKQHQLVNDSQSDAGVLWICTPPTF